MSDIQPSLRSRLLKLLALAREGVDGERDNAATILDGLLRKHDLSLEDIERDADPQEEREFVYKGQTQRTLLINIICRVLNVNEFTVSRRPRSRTSFHLPVTSSQYAEIVVMFDIYAAQLATEMDRLLTAFILKHRLRGPALAEQPTRSPPDPEDARAVYAMMSGLSDVSVHRRITATNQEGVSP